MRLTGEYQRDETAGVRFSDPHDGQNGLLARPTALLGDRLSDHTGIHLMYGSEKRSSLLSGQERLFIIGWIITSETSQSGQSQPGSASPNASAGHSRSLSSKFPLPSDQVGCSHACRPMQRPQSLILGGVHVSNSIWCRLSKPLAVLLGCSVSLGYSVLSGCSGEENIQLKKLDLRWIP